MAQRGLCFRFAIALYSALAFLLCARTAALADSSQNTSPVTVLHAGVSTLLFDDGQTQILFDGFFTRPSSGLLSRIAPDPDTVWQSMLATGITPAVCAGSRRPSGCPASGRPRLAAVIPLHGHYDHAMDSALVAGFAGADLVADLSVQRLRNATEDLGIAATRLPDWSASRIVELDLSESDRVLHYGDFEIRLFPTSHVWFPFLGLASGTTSNTFEFPAGRIAMRKGTTVSALVRHGDLRILVISTAGKMDTAIADRGIRADIALLGVGGLGVKGRDYIRNYWRDIVTASEAGAVFPIHWDDNRMPLPAPGGCLNKTTDQRIADPVPRLLKLADKDGVALGFLPLMQAYRLTKRPDVDAEPVASQCPRRFRLHPGKNP